jgi:hypothetical protein
MSMPTGDHEYLRELETEVESELAMAESSHPEESMSLPINEWLFDPVDAQQEEIGLLGLRDAVETLEGDPRRGAAHGLDR